MAITLTTVSCAVCPAAASNDLQVMDTLQSTVLANITVLKGLSIYSNID